MALIHRKRLPPVSENTKKKKYVNHWKSEWLQKEVCDRRVGDAIRKRDKDGEFEAFCEPCEKRVHFGSRGFVAIKDHIERPSHQRNVAALKGNSTLEGGSVEENQSAYVPPVVPLHDEYASSTTEKGSAACNKLQKQYPGKLIPLKDRVYNMEALTLAFAAETNLSLSTVPKIISFAKVLAQDPKALRELKMSRITASYKIKCGLEKTLQEELLRELREVVFSLHIDEATNKTDLKVLTVLVNHFSPGHGKLMTHHLGSLRLRKVTAESLFESLLELFESLSLPWSNILSIMMDSCAVMRGSKHGLETLIRQRKAAHLLDVDGDTCHHAHNASKKFCSAFGGVVERLLMDLHTDFKWSTEHTELLSDLCVILGVKPSAPVRYVPHRWLSVLHSTERTLQLVDALTLFYYSFLDSKEQKLFADIVDDILKSTGQKSRKCVQEIQMRLAKKFRTFTSEGKQRKTRIIDSLFTHRPSTLLTLNLYSAVLPSLNKYVTQFQSKTPMIHCLLTEQQKLLEDFFSLFVKSQAIKTTYEQVEKDKSRTPVINRPSYLKKIDLTDKENILPSAQLFVGTGVETLFKAKVGKHCVVNEEEKKSFLRKVKQAYLFCGKALQEKMPLDNKTLKICSALDPSRRCTEDTRELLLCLPNFIPTLSSSNAFAQEVRSYNVTQTLQLDAACPVDQWWDGLKHRYPLLCQGAFAMLSCFHGPLVESSFSAMSDIMDCHSARLSVDVFSAVQSVRHFLQARDTTAVGFFSKTNPFTDPVDKDLKKNFRDAYKGIREKQNNARYQKAQKKASLGVQDIESIKIKSLHKTARDAGRLQKKLTLEIQETECSMLEKGADKNNLEREENATDRQSFFQQSLEKTADCCQLVFL